MKRKLNLINLVALFSLVFMFPMNAKTKTDNSQKVSLLEAIEKISKEYEVYFTFDMTLVADVRVEYKHASYNSAEDAIASILEGTGLKFKFYDLRFVILYKEDAEGLESLKQMSRHLEGLIHEGEKSMVTGPQRGIQTVNKLSSRLLERTINPIVFTVEGDISDPSGDPLIGVNIQVKGTSIGTSTDIEGRFALEDIDENAVLVVSYVGYQTQEVPVTGKSTLSITLVSDSQLLDEVVVVGYGTQKKVNLTGAVSSISSKELSNRAVTKTSLALQGQMSGISVRQGSGNPRGNSATLTVRGQGTFSGAGNNPLVLVDGIESSMDNVDPNDVESISVLKDAASAAIYGSKAANGVILIETKQGIVGKPILSYETYFGKNSPTTIPEMINSWEYAEVENEITPNRYSKEEIQKFRSGGDPEYPNFDHIGYLFGSGSGLEMQHNLSLRGGNTSTKYMFSAGYFNQNAIIKKNSANRYSLRMNLNTKILDNLIFDFKFAAAKFSSDEPSWGYGGGVGGIVLGAMRNRNAIPGPTIDGYWGRNSTSHPEADLNSNSFLKDEGSNLYSNANIIWNITQGFSVRGQIGYTQGNSNNKTFIATYPVTDNYSISPNSLDTKWFNSSNLTLQSIIDYNKKINDHSFHLLGGVSHQAFDNKNISAYRDEFPNNELYEINAGATARGLQGGTASRSTLASYFGRVNYNFQEKYLFETNFRYDGSSRFPADSRWGFFPSASVGWRLSEEDFFKDALSSIYNLKFRASWGELGNQSIGNYPYQDLISLGQNYPFGSELSAGASVNTIANKEITWETTAITDMGVDMGLLSGKLNFSIDYFIKRTSDILYNVSVSNLLGATPSATNAGTVVNKGWDFDIGFNNSAGDFTYGVRAIFSFVDNKVETLANIEQDINRGLFIGYPIGSAYGYVSDGLFRSDEEVSSYATQPFSFLAEGGGIKYVDLSGPNGVPDGVVNSTYDRRIIGKPLPSSTYALSFNGGFKGFDLSVLLQGEGGRKDMINIGQFFFPLENNSNIQREAFENRWTQENPNPEATYPRMKYLTSGFYSSNDVDYWYRDATFLRLKNIQIGYKLSEGFLSNSFLSKIRVYVTGENLFTLTKFYDGWDPEMRTGGGERFYPLTKKIVGGISIKL